MKNITVFALLVSLAVNAGLGLVAWDLRQWSSESQQVVFQIHRRVEQLERNDAQQADEISQLDQEQEFDPSMLEQDVATLRGDIDDLRSTDQDILTSLEEVLAVATQSSSGSPQVESSAIKKPVFCFAGDVARWDYGDGLTC